MNTRRKAARLAAGEIEILEILWRIESATISEAHEALAREIGYTTVQTRLNRLVVKGLVRKGGSHPARYQAAIKPEQVCRGDLDVLV
jgi:BlaI family transcriptional regulator, penicillinase repressor